MSRLAIATILALALALAVVGCGPSVSRLVADHHYREAICAAHDGDAEAKQRVGAGLDHDTGLTVIVQPIADAEVAALLPRSTATSRRAAKVLDDVRFVRIDVQTNALPVDAIAAGIKPNALDVQPVSREALAEITGEVLPRRVVRTTYLTGGNVLRGLAGVITLGTSLLVAPMREGLRQTEAPDDDYIRLAPIAQALYHAMSEGCRDGGVDDTTSLRCHWFYMTPRSTRASVVLRLFYRASRRDRMGQVLTSYDDTGPRAPCSVERAVTVDLGEPAR